MDFFFASSGGYGSTNYFAMILVSWCQHKKICKKNGNYLENIFQNLVPPIFFLKRRTHILLLLFLLCVSPRFWIAYNAPEKFGHLVEGMNHHYSMFIPIKPHKAAGRRVAPPVATRKGLWWSFSRESCRAIKNSTIPSHEILVDRFPYYGLS